MDTTKHLVFRKEFSQDYAFRNFLDFAAFFTALLLFPFYYEIAGERIQLAEMDPISSIPQRSIATRSLCH
jgi:hypothetical protein